MVSSSVIGLAIRSLGRSRSRGPSPGQLYLLTAEIWRSKCRLWRDDGAAAVRTSAEDVPGRFLARWRITDNQARSPDVPAVVIPGAPFLGTMGVAPSRELQAAATRREQVLATLATTSGFHSRAIRCTGGRRQRRASQRSAARARRNLDFKTLGEGSASICQSCVWCLEALLSMGDPHFAQGDGESCGTAIEVAATVRLDRHTSARRRTWTGTLECSPSSTATRPTRKHARTL